MLPHLAWNDLLRLRRVCSWTKGITDAYLQVNPQLAPEIEINEGNEKTLKSFMDLGIPTTKLFLNNKSGYSFYENIGKKTEHQFLNKFGPLIKHLRVSRLTSISFGRELNFINGMKNLKSFEADYFGHGRKTDEDVLSNEAMAHYQQLATQKSFLKEDRCFPLPFQSLETIKIGPMFGQDYEYLKRMDVVCRSGNIFYICPQLKYACLPFDSTFKTPEFGEGLTEDALFHGSLPRALLYLGIYTAERPNDLYPPSGVNGRLEVYDFQNYHNDSIPWAMEYFKESFDKLRACWVGSKDFVHVCLRALETGLKLLNVDPRWYCARYNVGLTLPELGIPVVSLVGLDPCMRGLDMPNLEKITIPFTSGSLPGDPTRPRWPALKIVDITVDGKVGCVWDMYGRRRIEDCSKELALPTTALFRFLFWEVVRANMTELSIRFVDGKGKKELEVPNVEDIVKSCPNLKKIKLGNWMGTNKQLVELWNGLLGLEEISLENCKELGNVAFVGEDVGNPVFLRLESKLNLCF